jgi:hypothetical protein
VAEKGSKLLDIHGRHRRLEIPREELADADYGTSIRCTAQKELLIYQRMRAFLAALLQRGHTELEGTVCSGR